MKKAFSLLLIACFLSNAVFGQDFEPGVQAKGYMDDENTSVDLSTGLFHYKVPLFVVSEGGFNLPVSLNYVGKAVTKDDIPGQVGFNWSLQAGGVVTRIVRGGIADDASNGAMGGAAGNVVQASLRERDGEKDIFTANFNNRRVSFVLSSNYRVNQLEKSNVEISCLRNLDGITGWKVIDENGVQYIYRETEEFENRSREASVSYNNVVDKSYISSWFITSIVVPNADTIKFQYGVREISPPYDIQPNMEDRVVTEISTRIYRYGRAMNEYIFNDTYLSEYKEAINSALFYMQQEHVSMQNDLNREISNYTNNYNTWNNNFALIIRQQIQYHQRVMGVLTNIKNISEASLGLAMYLDELIDYCKSVGGTMSASSLQRAKSLFKLMCTRAKPITEKRIQMTSRYRVKTPVLKRIVTRNKDVVFAYQSVVSETESKLVLQKLDLLDANNGVIQQVKLTRSIEGCLKEIKSEITGNDAFTLSFSYFLENTSPIDVDLWGQWMNFRSEPLEDKTRHDFDPVYMKRFSLSGIKYSTGMSVDIDYEPNLEKINPNMYMPSGGIRVRSVVINKGNGYIESLTYGYPNGAKPVFGSISNRDIVHYYGGTGGPFQDIVIKDRIIPQGVAYVSTGNNGVYYDRVVVNSSGKGKRVYSFYVPSPAHAASRFAFPHGLCGLMLGYASYDKNDHLVELVRNTYESGYAPLCIDPGFASWFVLDNNVGPYERSPQVKPFEYCLDRTKLEADFRAQHDVVTYADKDGSLVLSPYHNIYKENIEPRVDVVLPDDSYYYLLYEGKTVLSEQVVYHFPDDANIPFSIDHVKSAPPSRSYVVKHVNFKYLNRDNVFPLQIVEYLSNGDTLVTVTRTPVDMGYGVSSVLNRMRAQHMIAPIVKKQQFLKPKNSGKYYLLGEVISCFKDTVAPSGKPVFLLDRVYNSLKRDCDSLVPSAASWDEISFSLPLSDYKKEQDFRYRYAGGHFLPVEIGSPAATSVNCHDPGRGNIIMKAEGTRRSLVDVIDAFRVPVSPGTDTTPKDGSLGKGLPTSLVVKPEQSVVHFRVYMLVKTSLTTTQINYSITRGSTVTRDSSDLIRVNSGEWALVTFDVHLPAGINKLEVLLPSEKVALATLTPVGIAFEAMSYDLEGKLFCKLNQNGQLERYEYGSFKKLKRVWDEKGNILYESYSNF